MTLFCSAQPHDPKRPFAGRRNFGDALTRMIMDNLPVVSYILSVTQILDRQTCKK